MHTNTKLLLPFSAFPPSYLAQECENEEGWAFEISHYFSPVISVSVLNSSDDARRSRAGRLFLSVPLIVSRTSRAGFIHWLFKATASSVHDTSQSSKCTLIQSCFYPFLLFRLPTWLKNVKMKKVGHSK
uniref:Uncharacterized protein n=1 Tax=Palpitomonas bilix TaxID=652834 RepID=A0A7S3DJX1_9EUKA|mmetsp:Transcript_40192/g.104119  ORF Transcript_40192/g.104119 Transcript_40192/m.104119 type:complete len:129 (+) Transcript_40192:169-555(+)